MNWTGGRLTRGVRKADNSVINKQKQHFATVRNALLHGAKKSPAKWSIFDSITINVKCRNSDREDNTRIRHGEKSFSRYHGRHSSDLHQDSGKHRREVEEPENLGRSKRRKLSPLKPKDRHDSVKIKKEAYEASIHKLHKTDVTDVDDEMEVLRRKKLKLLRKSDWLSLGLQEPLKLKYASTGVDDRIGRRRRLKPGHEARYEKSHVRLSPAHRHNYDTRSEVRVTIDGKERRVGVSSSAAPRRVTEPPISSHSQSSDVMLLEGPLESEASQVALDQHGRHWQRRRSHSYMDDHNECYQAFNKHRKEKTPPWDGLSRLPEEAGREPRLNDNQPFFSSSSIRTMAEARGLADSGNNESFKGLLSSSLHASSQVLPSLPASPIHNDPNGGHARNQGRLIMPSSPPILHHPIPRRATSQILRTNSLDIASSAAATVGVPTLTEAEAKGDKMWKDWLDEDAVGSDAGPGPHEDCATSVTPGVSQYVPARAVSQSSPITHQSQSDAVSAGSRASTRDSDASMPHNMMHLSSSFKSTTASRTPSVRPQAMSAHQTRHPMAPPPGANVPPQPDFQEIVSFPLSDVKVTQRVDDDAAWKTFVQSPSELIFDDESPRPFQKPPLRRPPLQENQRRKPSDPDAAWKSFVLTNDSDSEGENPAFTSFWKKNETRPSATINATMRPAASEDPLLSHASLKVHPPTSMNSPELPELPFFRPGIRTPGMPMSHTPFFSTSTSEYFNDDSQMLDDTALYANHSQIASTDGDLKAQVIDDRSMYVNQSVKSLSSASVSSAPFQLDKRSGQTKVEGFFKPPPMLHAKAPLGYRNQSTFRRLVPFVTPQKAGRQNFVGGLDKKYAQEANRELRKELWKKPTGITKKDDRDDGRGRRQTKSIWDIPSSDDDHIQEM